MNLVASIGYDQKYLKGDMCSVLVQLQHGCQEFVIRLVRYFPCIRLNFSVRKSLTQGGKAAW